MADQYDTYSLSAPTTKHDNIPKAQEFLHTARTIRSLPQRRNKRPRLNHFISPPPPTLENESPTEPSRSGSPATPPTGPLAFHSPRTKQAIATLTDSIAALNIQRPSRTPMNSEETQLYENEIDVLDSHHTCSFRVPQPNHRTTGFEDEDGSEHSDPDADEAEEEDENCGPEDDGGGGEDEQQEEAVDEADQDFSGYTFLSSVSPNRTSQSSVRQSNTTELPSANRKKRKVPSPVTLPLSHPSSQYGLEYEARPANAPSGYEASHPSGQPGPAFGQLLRAAQLDGESGEYDDADEEEDTSEPIPQADLTDPVLLAKALSSHHVKMRKKSISSPRHYGRHLHKLAIARLLCCPPSGHNHLFVPNPPTVLPNQTAAPAKKTKPSAPTPRSSPAPKRVSKGKLIRHRPPAPTPKLKVPVLPNLYDPSLPLEVVYPLTLNPADLIKSRSSYHGCTCGAEEGRCLSYGTVFPYPSRRSGSRDLTISDVKDTSKKEEGVSAFGIGAEFSFRLEIEDINKRLNALHLAIAEDKQTRATQIREAMKIAMEQQQDIRLNARRSAIALTSTEANKSSGGVESQPDQQMSRSSRKHVAKSVNSSSQTALTSSRPTNGQTPLNQSSNSYLPEKSSVSRFDHGPSGPPPSEPPPPLPTNTNAHSSANRPPSTGAGRVPEATPIPLKKNGKKGKKKRSAHANANNVHHRDNYIPSRLPTTHQQTSTAIRSGLGTELATIDLLAQDYDPTGTRSTLHPFIDPNLSVIGEGEADSVSGGRGVSHSQLGSSAISNFFVEPDEWICGFCEYELWFGEELSLVKVIKNRKAILRRRKRAKDRAARAAAGIKNAPPGAAPPPAPGPSLTPVVPPPPPPPPSSAVSN